MAELPISNVINVNLAGLPSGFTERNINTIGIFTNETPNNVDPFREYISAQQVAEDYGTSAVTTQMANAIFAQSPNIRSGNGKLVIMPFAGVSATGGDFVTTDISGNLTNFYPVTDGEIRVTLNGEDIDLLNISFAGASSIEDVAQVLQARLQNVVVSVENSNTIKFASKKVGATSAVTLSAVPAGSGTDLSGAGFLDVSGGTATTGTDSSGETVLDAIARTETQVFYAGIITNADLEDTAITTIANGVQSKDKMFLHHASSTEDITGLAKDISDAGNSKTRIITYTLTNQADANLAKSAYVGRGFSVDTRGSNTAITMNLKSLNTILPDTNITQTDYNTAKTNGTDLYVSYEGVPSVLSTGGNKYFDVVYFELAYKFALEATGFNYLRQTNTKVPQDEQGMNGLKDAFNQVAERFVRANFIGLGLTWNSSETFGNPETFRRNITERGFYTYSLPIAQQDQSQRQQRIAPLVQQAVKLAGAIHEVNINVTVEE